MCQEKNLTRGNIVGAMIYIFIGMYINGMSFW